MVGLDGVWTFFLFFFLGGGMGWESFFLFFGGLAGEVLIWGDFVFWGHFVWLGKYLYGFKQMGSFWKVA